MSTTDPLTLHFMQQNLSDKDKDIPTGIKHWLNHATFDPTNGLCIDENWDSIWVLLTDMDVVKKVKLSLDVDMLINRCFIHPPNISNQTNNPRSLPNAKTPHSMISIRIIEGDPIISGHDAEHR